MSSSEDDQPRSKSANPQQTDKYKDIFGSESELSEEESDKEVKVAGELTINEDFRLDKFRLVR